MKNLSGVESVEVSLNKGSAVVKLRPGNTVTIKQIHEGITKNGFATKQTNLIVRGILFSEHNVLKIRVAGSNEVYTLSGDVIGSAVLLNRNVELEGTIPAVLKDKSADAIQVKAIKAVEGK